MIIFQEYQNFLIIEPFKDIHIVSSLHHNGLKTGYFTNKITNFIKDNGGLLHHQCYSDLIDLRKTVISSMFYDIDKNNITSSYMKEYYVYLNYNNLRGLKILRVRTSEEYGDIDKEKI